MLHMVGLDVSQTDLEVFYCLIFFVYISLKLTNVKSNIFVENAPVILNVNVDIVSGNNKIFIHVEICLTVTNKIIYFMLYKSS